MKNLLIDQHERQIKKLRLSLLDTCNLRCFYCMPESVHFMPKENWLSAQELHRICKNLVDNGIEEIRLTGGEPTLRSDFLSIAERLSALPLKKLALTTNAFKLEPLLEKLKETNLKSINISLDSLNDRKFEFITKTHGLSIVINAIEKAVDLGFKVKINTVLLKNVNDNEIDDFVDFSKKFNVPVRFLEVMKVGTMVPQFEKFFLEANFIINHIAEKYNAQKIFDPKDSTSINYNLNNGARIGLIASETKSFCGNCSRLRMGPDGTLYPCLFVDQGLNIRNARAEEYHYILNNLINKKPTERLHDVSKPMFAIGG